MSLFNRVLEIKFSILISILTGIALVSSMITLIVVNSTKQECLPCQSIEPQSKAQPKTSHTREQKPYLVPSDNGRNF